MHCAQVLDDADPVEWLHHAAAVLAEGLPPEAVTWQTAEAPQADLFGAAPVAPGPAPRPAGAEAALRSAALPEDFIARLRRVICHADPGKHALLYRVAWRLQSDARLLQRADDADLRRLLALEQDVRRAAHKMKAFLRFRHRPEDDVYIAWFDPGHPLLRPLARFFLDRYASQRWIILTPYGSASWDGRQLAFGPPAPRGSGPQDDPCEALWRTYYASIFNPARLKVRAMTKEMPQRYWRDLPEASLIAPLVRDAGRRTADMVAAARRLNATISPPDASLDG